jgi:hypothetical protein
MSAPQPATPTELTQPQPTAPAGFTQTSDLPTAPTPAATSQPVSAPAFQAAQQVATPAQASESKFKRARGKKAKQPKVATQDSPILDALLGKPQPGERRSLFGLKFGAPAPPVQQAPAAGQVTQSDDQNDSSHLAA